MYLNLIICFIYIFFTDGQSKDDESSSNDQVWLFIPINFKSSNNSVMLSLYDCITFNLLIKLILRLSVSKDEVLSISIDTFLNKDIAIY